MKIFHPESHFVLVLSRIADMMFVNVAFLIACIPVFTIGSAKAALFDCAAKWVDKDGDAGVMTFIRSFKANFRSGLLPGLLVFVITVLLCVDFLLSFSEVGMMFMRVVTIIVMVLFFSYSEQLFLFLSRFACKFSELLRNTLIMVLSNPIRSILCAVVMQLPLVTLLSAPELFIRLTMLWVLGYFSVAAFLSAKLMQKPMEMIISMHNQQIEESQT